MEQNCYKFKCSDLGMQCSFKAHAHSEGELMEQISKHAADVHNMSEPDEATMTAIKGAIRYDAEC
jgi:predicted small metal-binding protein